MFVGLSLEKGPGCTIRMYVAYIPTFTGVLGRFLANQSGLRY